MGGFGGTLPPGMAMTPAQQGGDADLLEGLKSSNAANQRAKVMHLKQRQDAGQGAGMGGVAGGFF